MRHSALFWLIPAGLLLAGCPLGPAPAPTGTPGGQPADQSSNPERSRAARVAAEVHNLADLPARVRIRMLLGQSEVHFAERHLPAGESVLIVGPDVADTVTVEAVWQTQPASVAVQREFRFGRDFSDDATLRIELTLPDDDQAFDEPNSRPPPPDAEPNLPPDGNDVGEPNVPPDGNDASPPLEFSLTQLTPGRTAMRGSLVLFRLHVAAAPPDAVVDVVAEPLSGGPEQTGDGLSVLVIAHDRPARDALIQWHTRSAVARTSYRVRARLRVGPALLEELALDPPIRILPGPRIRYTLLPPPPWSDGAGAVRPATPIPTQRNP